MRNILTRSWMHGRLWANDPDCLLARSTRTKLTLPEVQSLATAIAMSGGMTLISDNLLELASERLDIMSLLLPPLGQAASARDLISEAMPSHFEMLVERDFESWWLIARFNWERRRRTLATRLPPGRWHVYELWERRYDDVNEGLLQLDDVPAHGCRLLALRRALPHPQLLGSTFHFSMGGREVASWRFDRASGNLDADLTPVAKATGELVVSVPRGFVLEDARLSSRPVGVEEGPGTACLRFGLDAEAQLRLQFSRRGD